MTPDLSDYSATIVNLVGEEAPSPQTSTPRFFAQPGSPNRAFSFDLQRASMDIPSESLSGTPKLHFLRCLQCNRTIDCTQADLLQFTKTGWPRCCAEVMTLFTSTKKPDPGSMVP